MKNNIEEEIDLLLQSSISHVYEVSPEAALIKSVQNSPDDLAILRNILSKKGEMGGNVASKFDELESEKMIIMQKKKKLTATQIFPL